MLLPERECCSWQVDSTMYGRDLRCRKQPSVRGRGVSHCKNRLSPRFESTEAGNAEERRAKVMLPPELCLVHPLTGPLVRIAQSLPSIMRRLAVQLKHEIGNAEEGQDEPYYVKLPPELCLVHPLTGPLVRIARSLPSIMRRLAIQLKHEIGYQFSASRVLEALTAASCQGTFSFERAELLGDAYLKWVVSRWLFLKYPQNHEGQLTRMRDQNVSNMALYGKALQRGLQPYIQVNRFAPCRWATPSMPPVFDEDTKEEDNIFGRSLVNGDTKGGPKNENGEYEALSDSEGDMGLAEDREIEKDLSSYRVLSSKTLADVVEAVIGVYYVESGPKAASHLMDWIGIPSHFDMEEGTNARSGCIVPDTVLRSIEFEKLESTLGYNFKERSLLVEAITHASRPASGVPCYQRLEFVGDAVLDHLITRHFFFTYLDLPPGRLTDLRAAAVNNENLARVAVKHGLHLHLRHDSSALETQIRDFVKGIKSEVDKPGVNSFGLGDFKAPKVLADIVESIAGAVFLDNGLCADQVWKVFEPLLQPMVTQDTLPVHPVRELQERCQQQAERLKYKSSRTGKLATVEVYIDGVRVGLAQNPQKKMAQKLASRNALLKLKEKEADGAQVGLAQNPQKKMSQKLAARNALGKLKEKEASQKEGAKAAAEVEDVKKKANQTFARQMLTDTCLKRHWQMPQYRCISEVGPAHAKRFTYSVRIHTTEQGWTEECVGKPMSSAKKAKDSAARLLLLKMLESCSC